MSTTTPLAVELVHDDPSEQLAAAALERVLRRWPLDPYVYFDRVRIDGEADQPGGFPVPVLLPRQLAGDERASLAAFLHGQMHVALGELALDLRELEEEARARWGDDDAEHPCRVSRHLHVPVCALELAALTELLGRAAAEQVLATLPGYGPVLAQLLAQRDDVDTFLARHGVELGGEPPRLARRGLELETSANGPTAQLDMGQQLEVDTVERLRALLEAHDLSPWCFSTTLGITTGGPSDTSGGHPVMSSFFLYADDADFLLHYLQTQAGWWVRRFDAAVLETAVGAAVDAAQLDAPGVPRSRLLQVAAAGAIALHGLRSIVDDEDVSGAVERHPRNRVLYQSLAAKLPDTLDRLTRAGVPVDVTGSQPPR